METKKVYAAISNVSAKLLDGIRKDKRNQQQGFSFRGIDDVYNALAPVLVENKLIIMPRMLERNATERVNNKGTTLFYVTVTAEFDFVSVEDGSVYTARTYGEAMDSGDKATNKAMSIAYKYAAFQAFCIPTEDTTQDPDATTHTLAPSGSAKPQQQQQAQGNQSGSDDKPWYNTFDAEKEAIRADIQARRVTPQQVIDQIRASWKVKRSIAEEILAMGNQ
ncbi:MAG: ERF family protein [Cetobacterium sp.]|uniref:ERF family protein n=1 Tax=Cetobacterium sp. TaxID=2071632 RepID=UPI003F4016D6